MERCKTCKWWDRKNAPESEWGGCALISDWFLEIEPSEDRKERAGAFTTAQGDVASLLSTHVDFGCVQHEPREDTQ